jgi:hypothetical protein
MERIADEQWEKLTDLLREQCDRQKELIREVQYVAELLQHIQTDIRERG